MFDVVVIGGGMIGASAARHLAQSGLDVGVVAPPEPVDAAVHTGSFGAHYDETRLSRTIWADPLEAELMRRAELAKPDIEEFSDRPVYSGPGYLYAAVPDEDEGLGDLVAGMPEGHGIEVLGPAALAERYPEIHFQEEVVGYLEPGGGCLNPRALVASQLRAATEAGAHIFTVGASGMTMDPTPTVSLVDGTRIGCRKVLVATGAFTNGIGLLERPLALRMKTETVLLAEIGEHEAERLAGLPPMHYGIHDPVVADIYAAPPTTYPDGSVLLKWGANTIRDRWVERPDEIAAWYRHGDGDDIVELMRPSMEATYPGIEVTGWRTHRCVVTYTGHGHTYIDAVEPGRLYLAVGGHGRSAKCADPLGALAASLVANDAWVDPLPADRFRAMYQGEVEDWPCRDLMADRPT